MRLLPLRTALDESRLSHWSSGERPPLPIRPQPHERDGRSGNPQPGHPHPHFAGLATLTISGRL